MNRYKLTDESIEVFGKKLFRIIALKSFADVEKDCLGGYLEREENLPRFMAMPRFMAAKYLEFACRR